MKSQLFSLCIITLKRNISHLMPSWRTSFFPFSVDQECFLVFHFTTYVFTKCSSPNTFLQLLPLSFHNAMKLELLPTDNKDRKHLALSLPIYLRKGVFKDVTD